MPRVVLVLAAMALLAGRNDQHQTVAVSTGEEAPDVTVPVIAAEVSQQDQDSALAALAGVAKRDGWTNAVALSEVMTGDQKHLRWKVLFQTTSGIRVGESADSESLSMDTLVSRGDLFQIHHEKEFDFLSPDDVVVIRTGVLG